MAALEALHPDAIAERVTRWRPMPPSLFELLSIRQDDPASSARLREVVAADADLDRRLQVIGAASDGLAPPAQGNVIRAVGQIGYRRVHSAAVATLLIDALAADAHGFDFLDYWRRATACGSLAASLADYEHSEARDLAYAAGLLHQVGLLAIDMAAPSALAALFDAMADEGWSEALEDAVLGYTVREVTSALHVRWRLPLELSEAHLVTHAPALWHSRPVGRALGMSLQAIDDLGVADPLRGVPVKPGMAPEPRFVLDRYFGGGTLLVEHAETLLANCLLAREQADVPAD